MIALALWALWCPFDVALLGSEDFDVRRKAHARLRVAGPCALPALALGRGAQDLEVRWRCREITRGPAVLLGHTSDALLAAWLFWGPDELPGKARRFLREDGPTWRLVVSLDNLAHRRLAGWARWYGLLSHNEPAACEWPCGMPMAETVGWVGVMRHRAYGMRLP